MQPRDFLSHLPCPKLSRSKLEIGNFGRRSNFAPAPPLPLPPFPHIAMAKTDKKEKKSAAAPKAKEVKKAGPAKVVSSKEILAKAMKAKADPVRLIFRFSVGYRY